jgi:hypothetical protein
MATRKISRRFDESVSMAAITTVVVTPDDDPTEVEEEATQQFTAVIKDAAGNTIPQATGVIAWTVSDEDAGTISSSGLFTAGTAPETYQVTATHTASGSAASVDVEVTAAA